MAGYSDVFDSITNTAGTPANSYELGLDMILSSGGGYVNIPDVTNLNPVDTPKTRGRETYASKGVDKATKYASNMVVTVDIEIVRDGAGQWQPVLNDIVAAAQSKAAANRRAIRVYDLLGGAYAFTLNAMVSIQFSGTDWDSSKFLTVTFTGYDAPVPIANPTSTGVIPTVTSVLPTGAAVSVVIVIRGDRFTGATGGTVGGVALTSFTVLDDDTIRAVMPAGSAGSAPVIVTTPNGPSVAFPYTRA